MADSVAIIGGGIGGLAAAHHLSMAGVRGITVYESGDKVGGKARSQYPALGPSGAQYPGEHGFRFFPHFYRHLLDTLKQIEVGGETIWDRLVGPETAAIAYKGRPLLVVPRPVPLAPTRSFIDTTIDILLRPEVTLEEATRFGFRLLQFATSCTERRHGEYDGIAWSTFTGADSPGYYSPEFEDIVIRASQNLSAMRARNSSAATLGAITLQLLFVFSGNEKADALLCSPTDEAWLDDWRLFLEAKGVEFKTRKTLVGFDFDPLKGRIRGLRFDDGSRVTDASYYVSAIPLERFVSVLDPAMIGADPALAALPDLASRALADMTGLQFFLRRPTPITKGHVHYPGTPFALTSISQGQFWTPSPENRPGTPEIKDVLSVIISDWTTPGTQGIPACDYNTTHELADEVWRQMERALPPRTLNATDIIETHLDTNVTLNPFDNKTRLLIHPLDQRRQRPDAETGIENLFLASDFVQTHTDLATMEGADEAARRSTQAILRCMRKPPSPFAEVKPLDEGDLLQPAKAVDLLLWKLGLPHAMQPWRWRDAYSMQPKLAAAPSPIKRALDQLLRERAKLPPLDPDTVTLETLERWESFLRNTNVNSEVLQLL